MSYSVDPKMKSPIPLGYWESTGFADANGSINWHLLAWWIPLLLLATLMTIKMFKKEKEKN